MNPQIATLNGQPDVADRDLLKAAVRFNTRLLGFVCGLMGGLFMVAVTGVSLLYGGPHPGEYLSLLSIFLPGYRVDAGGMAIGFCWGLFYGGLSGMLVYWSYARVLGARLAQQIIDRPDSDLILKPATLTFPGLPLGLAVGLLMALQLLITTNWLVIRGTADTSVHAALLANYLPGYSVSVAGSLVGAAELFVLTGLVCMLVASIYNRITRLRHGE